MEAATPAEMIVRWLRTPGTKQTAVRWLALIPGVLGIFLALQLVLFIGISLVGEGRDIAISRWIINMMSATLVPFFVIKYGTSIAPSSHRFVSVVLAVVSVLMVALPRLAFELTNHDRTGWRYVWIIVAAALCCTSVWFGIRVVFRTARTGAPAV
jgi:hypothetical protein